MFIQVNALLFKKDSLWKKHGKLIIKNGGFYASKLQLQFCQSDVEKGVLEKKCWMVGNSTEKIANRKKTGPDEIRHLLQHTSMDSEMTGLGNILRPLHQPSTFCCYIASVISYNIYGAYSQCHNAG